MQLSITAPIFLMIALGYGAVRLGIFPKAMVPGLGQFVLFFAVPALIFRTLMNADFSQVLNPTFLAVYAAGGVGTMLLALFTFRKVMGRPFTHSAYFALGCSFPNSIFVGLPVLLQIFHGQPPAAFAMALMVENIVLLPLGMILMELGGEDVGTDSLRKTLKAIGLRLLKNPILMALLAGILAAAVDLQLPEVIDKVIVTLGNASSGTALFFIGGVLVGSDWRKHLSILGGIASGKLLLHPLLIAAIVWLLPPFDPDLTLSVMVLASAPMAAIYPILGNKFGLAEEGANAMLVTTASSFITLTAILWILTPG
ncbi:MAG: AEC family transporter [Magnetospiraceae bacterium]